MAWIESHQELREHPKTKRLCRLLALPRPMVVGYLHFLWWWAYDYAPEGDLSVFSDEDIADAVDWEGEPSALMSALVQAGFVTEDRRLHDWEDFAQKWIERRRQDRERKRATRSAGEPDRRTSNGSPPEIHSLSGVTVPDHTVPDHTGPDPETTTLASQEIVEKPSAAGAAGQAAILRGLSEDARAVLDHHREQHGKRSVAKLTPESARALEEAVADLGLERLRESISYMARKIPPVPELSKAINAARTKRANDGPARAPNGYGNGRSALESRDASKFLETRTGTLQRR